MSKNRQPHPASGRRKLMRAMVDRGLISDGALFVSGSGQADREINQVVTRLDRALRREFIRGQQTSQTGQTRPGVYRFGR